VKNTAGGPNVKGKTAARQTCKDGDAGCDADGTVNGSCTFIVAACFSREDGRFTKCPVSRCRRGRCSATSIPRARGERLPGRSRRARAVHDVGPRGHVHADAGGEERVLRDVRSSVAAGSKLVLKARTDALAGKPKDTDVLRLACTR
jgi:hypothetical protein